MDDTSRRKPYHHGNLREALVAAALALIEEKGPLGFTLAEAARGAGSARLRPTGIFAVGMISLRRSRGRAS